jgi:hypothetical protein
MAESSGASDGGGVCDRGGTDVSWIAAHSNQVQKVGPDPAALGQVRDPLLRVRTPDNRSGIAVQNAPDAKIPSGQSTRLVQLAWSRVTGQREPPTCRNMTRGSTLPTRSQSSRGRFVTREYRREVLV